MERITNDEIMEALCDYQWRITSEETVGEYAQSISNMLGCSKKRVLKVIRQEDENISENDNMAKLAGLE